jgi:hypothetical protein
MDTSLDTSSGDELSRRNRNERPHPDDKPPIFDETIRPDNIQNVCREPKEAPKKCPKALPTPPSPPKQSVFNRFAAFQPDLPPSEDEEEKVDYETAESMLAEQQEALRLQKLERKREKKRLKEIAKAEQREREMEEYELEQQIRSVRELQQMQQNEFDQQQLERQQLEQQQMEQQHNHHQQQHQEEVVQQECVQNVVEPVSNSFAPVAVTPVNAQEQVPIQHAEPIQEHKQPTLSELIAQEQPQDGKWPLASPDESAIRPSPARSSPGRKIFKAKAGHTHSLDSIIQAAHSSDVFEPSQECQRDAAELAAEYILLLKFLLCRTMFVFFIRCRISFFQIIGKK